MRRKGASEEARRGREAGAKKGNRVVRKLLVQLGVSCGLMAGGLGLFLHGGREALRARVERAVNRAQQGLAQQQKQREEGCRTYVSVVLPSVVNPGGRVERLRAIAETWGEDARAVFVAHDGSPEATEWPALEDKACDKEASFPRTLVVPKDIPESRGVARLRWVLEHVGASANTTKVVDHVFLCNDHTFVIARNLECFLRSVLPDRLAYLGHPLKNRGGGANVVFNSGAAGYVLTRATLQVLAASWDRAECAVPAGNKWLEGNPGLVLARCLFALNAPAADTRAGAGHRFHAYGPVRTVTGSVDDWYKRMHADLAVDPPATVQAGADCCARYSVSFHYVEAAEQRVIFAALQNVDVRGLHDRGPALDWLRQNWPPKSLLGGYSAALPSDVNDLDRVAHLLFNHILLADRDTRCTGYSTTPILSSSNAAPPLAEVPPPPPLPNKRR